MTMLLRWLDHWDYLTRYIWELCLLENRDIGEKENLGGLILVLKFSYSGSKYGQQTFAISFKPLANQVDVFQEELALASLLLRFTNVQEYWFSTCYIHYFCKWSRHAIYLIQYTANIVEINKWRRFVNKSITSCLISWSF